MDILNWIQNWYVSQCDGEWEHEYGVKIDTIDNPGWSVKIDLAYTNWEYLEIPWTLHENHIDDWYGYSIKEKTFNASGDPSKLEFLLMQFRKIVESF